MARNLWNAVEPNKIIRLNKTTRKASFAYAVTPRQNPRVQIIGNGHRVSLFGEFFNIQHRSYTKRYEN